MTIGRASWAVASLVTALSICIAPATGQAQLVVDGWTAEQQLMTPTPLNSLSTPSDDIFGYPGVREGILTVIGGSPASSMSISGGTLTLSKDAGNAVQVELRYAYPGVGTGDLTADGADALLFPAQTDLSYSATLFIANFPVFFESSSNGDLLIPFSQIPMGVDLTQVKDIRLQLTLGVFNESTPAASLVSNSPFRTVPEPSQGLLTASSIASVLWLAGRRRRAS